MPRSTHTPAHEIKVAIIWWMLVAGMCVALANVAAAGYVH
jgi:hypothetical protein